MSELSRETSELSNERTSTRNARFGANPTEPSRHWDSLTREAEAHRAAKNAAWSSWAFWSWPPLFGSAFPGSR